MSGGHWDYLSFKLQERAVSPSDVLVAQIEHELDWGYSGDTCSDCAERRVLAALSVFFSDEGITAHGALERLKDRRRVDMCRECLALDDDRIAKERAR